MLHRRNFMRSSAALAAGAVVPLELFAQEATKVGFVYVSPIGDAGWTYQHELGRRELERALGARVQTNYVEKVAEGADAERVIREFAASGHRVVFATSFGYMNYVERVARQFPKVTFLHATGYKVGRNFAPYNARFYEGRYLNGVVAGRMTKSNILGYVAAFPIPEVLQGINAFTLGARSVNPKAELRVIWINAWYDPGKEREAAMTLASQGADMLTHHTDSTATMQAAEERGVKAFSYHSDMSKYGPNAQLTGTTHRWGEFYTKTVQDVIAGTWKPVPFLGGFREGTLRLAPFSPSVPDDVKAQVAELEAGLKAGTLHPFAGPIVDQSGQLRVPEGTTMDAAALGRTDFFVQGVASKLPTK